MCLLESIPKFQGQYCPPPPGMIGLILCVSPTYNMGPGRILNSTVLDRFKPNHLNHHVSGVAWDLSGASGLQEGEILVEEFCPSPLN